MYTFQFVFFSWVNQLFAEAMTGDAQQQTLNCGLYLSDIKSLLPGEELNDKVCDKESTLMPTVELLLTYKFISVLRDIDCDEEMLQITDLSSYPLLGYKPIARNVCTGNGCRGKPHATIRLFS